MEVWQSKGGLQRCSSAHKKQSAECMHHSGASLDARCLPGGCALGAQFDVVWPAKVRGCTTGCVAGGAAAGARQRQALGCSSTQRDTQGARVWKQSGWEGCFSAAGQNDGGRLGRDEADTKASVSRARASPLASWAWFEGGLKPVLQSAKNYLSS